VAREVAPYGSWASPLPASLVASAQVHLSYPRADGDDAYWIEGRPGEAGREVVVRARANGAPEDVLPDGFSARTLVHEYGSAPYAVREGIVFFANFEDQRLYRIDPGGVTRPLTPEPPTARAWRYADPVVAPDGTFLVCVRERHEAGLVVNELVRVDAGGDDAPFVLADGHDFVAAPALSPDGRRLAWIAWDHPRMPWDGTELHEMMLTEGRPASAARVVAGGVAEAVQQPRYGVDGSLHFVSDRSGWWNLYREGPGGVEALDPRPAEFGVPPWQSPETYVVRNDESVVAARHVGPAGALERIDRDGVHDLGLPFSLIRSLAGSSGDLVALVASPALAPRIVRIDPTDLSVTLLRESHPLGIDTAFVSNPVDVEFPTSEGRHAHAIYYPPTNPDFAAPQGTHPPLVVMSHGGPTSHHDDTLDYEVLFWTTRGFAVADVNYGGSTGYGRSYRERLLGRWGEVDLEDCVNAALFLAETGRCDRDALLIRGGSAGGYTTLSALVFRDVFAAGASYYGVGDLEALARDTHKFEARYLDSLVGPYPETQATYRERSPVHHLDLLATPVILFQGLEDQVVPPAQAEAMAEALRRRGVPFAYLAFEGEQHGFRRAENVVRTLEAELAFYARVLGFTPAGDPVDLEIENADALG
jgi:dipeptidyl aminopeptidase/acylaminoacyl peptidase